MPLGDAVRDQGKPPLDYHRVDVHRVEAVAQPFDRVVAIFVRRIGIGIELVEIAPNPAAVFRRATPQGREQTG